MALSNLQLFQLVGQRMDWLSQRRDVLAENIANADTPGFRPVDLMPFEQHLARTGHGRLGMTLTSAAHIPEPTINRGSATEGRMGDLYEIAPDGNAVNLEQQLMRVAQVQMDHQLASSVYSKHLNMIRTALGRGR